MYLYIQVYTTTATGSEESPQPVRTDQSKNGKASPRSGPPRACLCSFSPHLEKIVDEDDHHRPVHRLLLQRSEHLRALISFKRRTMQ